MSEGHKIRLHTPSPVVRRLTQYLTLCRELQSDGEEWASSQEIADSLGLTPSTVRQDLSYLNVSGKARRGYHLPSFCSAISEKLGLHQSRRVLIVGAGNLGRALARHDDFWQQGFNIVALLDNNPDLIGRKVGRLTVQPADALEKITRIWTIDIGILAVPAPQVQVVADQLVAAGVSSLLNLAGGHIHAPENIPVIGARITENLQELAHALQEKEEHARRETARVRVFEQSTETVGGKG